MNNPIFLIYILFVCFIACEKELKITDFSDDFSFYESELRIEALMLPADSTAIVRIDKSVPLDEANLYNCLDDDNDWNYYYCTEDSISYESLQECENRCNNITNCKLHLFSCEVDEDNCDSCAWDFTQLVTYENKVECIDLCPGDCVTDDVGEDGKQAYDSNNDGDYEDRGIGGDIAPDTGEEDGIPGCNELNVDEYNEILPEIHLNSLCTVKIQHGEDICSFIYSDTGGVFFDDKSQGFDIIDVETVSYGAWIPDSCDIDFFTHYDTEYNFSCECNEGSGYEYYGEIIATDIIKRPVIFYTDTSETNVIACSDESNVYSCLESYHNSDTLFFQEGNDSAKIQYASLFETIKYQAVQYIYDEVNDRYVYYHGHRDGGTDSGSNIINNSICLMSEKVVAEKYPPFVGADQFKYDIFTFSKGYENYYFYIQLDLLDPERTNLRDKNGNPVMGAFGSMSGRTKYFQITQLEN